MLPINLSLENFCGHRRSSLDFTTIDLALILGEIDSDPGDSNSAGKSTIFDSITWVLFGKSSAKTIDDNILWGESQCSVSLIFEVGDGEIYKAVRGRTQGVSSKLLLYIKSGEGWSDISRNNIEETTAHISNLIKFSYDTFVNSVFFQQGELFKLPSSRPAEKLHILEKLLHLTEYDQYVKLVKKKQDKSKVDLATIDSHCKYLQKDLVNIPILEEKISLLQKQNTVFVKEAADLQHNLDHLKKQKDQVAIVIDKIKDVQKLSEEYEESKRRTNNKASVVEVAENDLLTYDVDQLKDSFLKELPLYNELVRQGNDNNVEDLEASMAKALVSLGELDGKISTIKEWMDSLSHIGDVCPICDSPLSEIQKSVLVGRKQEDILELTNLKNEIGKKHKQYAEAIAKERDRRAKENLSKKFLDNTKKKIEEFKSKRDQLEEKKKILKESQQFLRSAEERYNTIRSQVNLELVADIDSINRKIEDIENHLSVKNRMASNNLIEEGKLIKEIDGLKIKQGELEQALDQLAGATSNVAEWKEVFSLFKDTVRSVINSTLEDIEFYTNETLADISAVPLTVDIEPDTFNVQVTVRDMPIDFKQLSGGLKTRVSIALRLAFSKILANRTGGQIRFLLLDEISSPLDDNSVESLTQAIKALSKEFKILLVTHDNRLKSHFGDIITVSHTSGQGSTIIQ